MYISIYLSSSLSNLSTYAYTYIHTHIYVYIYRTDLRHKPAQLRLRVVQFGFRVDPITPVGSSGPNLKPVTVRVCGMRGLSKGMHTTQHPPSPASRAWTDFPTNVHAVPRAVSHVNTHRGQGPTFLPRERVE